MEARGGRGGRGRGRARGRGRGQATPARQPEDREQPERRGGAGRPTGIIREDRTGHNHNHRPPRTQARPITGAGRGAAGAGATGFPLPPAFQFPIPGAVGLGRGLGRGGHPPGGTPALQNPMLPTHDHTPATGRGRGRGINNDSDTDSETDEEDDENTVEHGNRRVPTLFPPASSNVRPGTPPAAKIHPWPVGESCPICMDNIPSDEERAVADGCGHGFHLACLQEWARQSHHCPTCRTDFNRILHHIHSQTQFQEQTIAAPPTVEECGARISMGVGSLILTPDAGAFVVTITPPARNESLEQFISNPSFNLTYWPGHSARMILSQPQNRFYVHPRDLDTIEDAVRHRILSVHEENPAYWFSAQDNPHMINDPNGQENDENDPLMMLGPLMMMAGMAMRRGRGAVRGGARGGITGRGRAGRGDAVAPGMRVLWDVENEGGGPTQRGRGRGLHAHHHHFGHGAHHHHHHNTSPRTPPAEDFDDLDWFDAEDEQPPNGPQDVSIVFPEEAAGGVATARAGVGAAPVVLAGAQAGTTAAQAATGAVENVPRAARRRRRNVSPSSSSSGPARNLRPRRRNPKRRASRRS